MHIKTIATTFLLIIPSLALAAPAPTEQPPIPAGASIDSLIIDKQGTVYFIDSNAEKRPFTSYTALLSYGFLGAKPIIEPNEVDRNLPVGAFVPPRDGSIFCSDRGADKGTCYLITDSQKAGFVSAAVFKGLGYSFGRALYGDISFLSTTTPIQSANEAHRLGTMINNNGTIQIVGRESLFGIPSLEIFNSYGFSFEDVVPANAVDLQRVQSTMITTRQPGHLSISGPALGNPTQ